MSKQDTKPSGLDWIDEVPSHWRVLPLKRVTDFYIGWTPPTERDDYFANGEHLWANISDLGPKFLSNTEKRVTDLAVKESRLRIARKGSLLFSFKLSVGQVSIADVDLFTNEAIATFPPVDGVDIGFLYWSLPICLLHNANENIYGAKILNQELIRNSKLIMPPPDEQRRIADFLDKAAGRIDTLVQKKQLQIDLLQERKSAIITRAVLRGLNPLAKFIASDVEWLPEIPSHWRVLSLKRTAREGYKTFIDGDWVEAPYITTSGVRLLQTGNVGIGVFKEQGFKFIAEESFEKLNCTEVSPGDVLICRLDGPVGRACLAPGLEQRMITSVDNVILKPAEDHDPRFLVYLMSSGAWLDWIASTCRVGGGFRLRVSRTMLGAYKVPIPPLDEQREIADWLDAECLHIDRMVKALGRSLEKLQEYKYAIVTAAVTGKINVREQVIA